MSSLTQTAYITRKSINIGLILLALIIIVRFSITLTTDLWKRLFPPPPPPATVAFGKLPYPSAQNNIATPAAIPAYSLETINEEMPAIPTTFRVYFMPRPGASFGSYEKMRSQASRLGFANTPTKLGSTAWQFTDPGTPLRQLDIDELSLNFRLTFNYLSDLSLFNQKNFTSVEAVTGQARSFFERAGVFSGDLATLPPTITFFRFDAGTLVPTTSLSNADAIGVSFNRAEIDNLPVFSPDPKQGLVSVLLSSSSDSQKQILDGRFFYTPIDKEHFATYPTIAVSVAVDHLKAGRVIYASLPTPLPETVTIRKIFLAYLDPYPPQSFLQPIFVFSDEKGFIAYVPLIDPNWLE